MKQVENNRCFGGNLSVWEHKSLTLKCMMRFSIFLPSQAERTAVPFLTFLSGLTCTYENFTSKAGAYGFAARAGLAIVVPDTSPRGDDVPDVDEYDFGKGAGFYLNATQEPWNTHYQMEDYIAKELNTLIVQNFPLLKNAQGICGHSMGGHGALTLGLKYPDIFKSISAFAPIVAPTEVLWGQKAFSGYLGADNRAEWFLYDACTLMTAFGERKNFPEILVDQGTDDSFLDEQLKPDLFVEACYTAGQKINLRMQDKYNHSYYFIQSFIEDHIKHHAQILAEKS